MSVEFTWNEPYTVKMGKTPELSPNSIYEVSFLAEGLTNFTTEVINIQCTAEKDAPSNSAEFYVYNVSTEGFSIKNSGGNRNFFNWQVTGV